MTDVKQTWLDKIRRREVVTNDKQTWLEKHGHIIIFSRKEGYAPSLRWTSIKNLHITKVVGEGDVAINGLYNKVVEDLYSIAVMIDKQ